MGGEFSGTPRVFTRPVAIVAQRRLPLAACLPLIYSLLENAA
jgi:hypothetical protein